MIRRFLCISILFFLISGEEKLFAKTNTGFFGEGKISSADPIILVYSDSTCTSYFISTGQEFNNRVLTVKIFDISGRELYTVRIQGGGMSKISVNNFSDGIYFLRLECGDEILCNRKIIVHHYL